MDMVLAAAERLAKLDPVAKYANDIRACFVCRGMAFNADEPVHRSDCAWVDLRNAVESYVSPQTQPQI